MGGHGQAGEGRSSLLTTNSVTSASVSCSSQTILALRGSGDRGEGGDGLAERPAFIQDNFDPDFLENLDLDNSRMSWTRERRT